MGVEPTTACAAPDFESDAPEAVTGDGTTTCTEAESSARTDACSVSGRGPSDRDLTLANEWWDSLSAEERIGIATAGKASGGEC